MKQGKHYLSIVIWIFLAAIVAYFGYNLATSLYTPLTTTTAVEYEAGAGYYATGFVARDESVIRSNYAISVLTVSEGQRVAAGGQVATGYLTDDAQARQSRIQELTDQLAQLRYAWQYSSSVYDQAQLDKQISESLISLNQYVCRRAEGHGAAAEQQRCRQCLPAGADRRGRARAGNLAGAVRQRHEGRDRLHAGLLLRNRGRL